MYEIVSIAAVVSYFIPMMIVLFKKLWKDPFFLLFAAYWGLGGIINATDLIPAISKETRYMIGVFYNMLDVPFILAIFYYTTSSILVRKFAYIAIITATGIEILSAVMNGLNYEAMKYSLGIGIVLVLIIVIWEIFRYLQKMEHSNRQNAKVFIYAALLFEYATFIVIYIFDYFVEDSERRDSFLIYYISTLVALFIASCGYLLFRKYEKNSSLGYIKER